MDHPAISSLLPVYRRYDLAFARGEGAWLWTTNGRRVLDFCSGIAVNALGHAHPAVVAAVSDQVRTLGHTSNLAINLPALELSSRLAALAATTDVETLTRWIERAEQYDAALRHLDEVLIDADGKVTKAVRKTKAA